MYLSKKKTLQILAYCATAAIFFGGTNIADAESSNNSSGNTVEINDESVTSKIVSDETTDSEIKDKSVTSDIIGGETTDGETSSNTVNISGDNTKINNTTSGTNGNTVGGRATGSGNASNNTVNIFGGTINSKIHVGEAVSGRVSGNVLNISDGNFTGGWLSGAYLKGNGIASGNVINIKGGDFNIGFIEGSWGYGTHTNNVVNISGGKIHGAIISGAYVMSNTIATGNAVNISKGTLDKNAIIAGAYMTGNGSARGNTTNVSDGNITGSVQGGYVKGSGDATGNTVNISGGTITGEILGGYVGSGTVKNNSINISGNPDLSGATIYAGKIGENNTNLYGSGNSLNIRTLGIKAKNIGGFDTLNFYIPAGISGTDRMLTLTGTDTNLDNTILNVYANGGANLQTGNQITLLYNGNGLGDIANLSDDRKKTIAQGISLEYDYTLERSADGKSYTAKIGQTKGLEDQVNQLNDGGLSASYSVTNGTDNLTGVISTEISGESIPTTQFNPFAGISGSVFKIKTSDGQKLKSKNAGIDVGMARYVRNAGGLLFFGPVTDYGRDSYDSSLTHETSKDDPTPYTTNGTGNSQYFAAGIFARQMNTNANGVPDGMYYEGSFRAGRVHTNFASDNFLVHGNPTHADYSASTPCFAGHVRVGWAGNIGGTSKLDAYAMYSRNRINGFTTTLSTGEEYKFSAVNSGRIRIGARLSRDYNIHTFYSGLAYIQEFSGATHGEYMGRSTGRSSLRGTSGMLELGWRVKQSATSDTMFDVYANGWVGHQKGVTFTAKFRRDF